jgi:hypothetical protein
MCACILSALRVISLRSGIWSPSESWQTSSQLHQSSAIIVKNAAPRPGHERNLLSPACGDLPVGRFVDRRVESPLQKYFAMLVGQIISTNSRHPTPQGAYRDRHGRGVRMRWTRQRFARDGLQGGSTRPVSDHQASGREMLQRTAKSCGPDAPTLASSLAEWRRPNRA